MYQLFEPDTIGGLPAVLQQTTPGALTCTVTTGIAVGQAADVTVSEIGVEPRHEVEVRARGRSG